MGLFSGITKLASNTVGAVGDVVGAVAAPVVNVAENVVSTVSNVAAKVDDAVNKVPGGWGTVAVVAGGASLLGGAGAGTAASSGTGLTAGGGGLGLTAGGSGLGLTVPGAASSGLGSTAIGAGLGTTLAGLNTGVGAGTAAGTTLGSLGMSAVDYSLTGAAPSFLGNLGNAGSAIWDFAKANPSIAGSLLGSITGAIGASNAPTSQTATTSIDPQIKQEYLANLERAKQAATGLTTRQFEGFTPDYTLAEAQTRNLGLGGKGQQTTDEAARLAMIEAGFTPQQIQAAQASRQNIQNASGQLGSQYMGAYQNPFEEQVVQGALGDIERSRQIQEQANMAQATAARAFGGSRQGVVSGMTNEAALRQAASTSGQLRQAGFNTAAQLGQSDAARALQAQLANQGVDITIEQANAQLRQQAALANQGAFAQGAGIRQAAIGQLGQFGAQQQNLGLTGSNAVMEAQMRQQALAQARLDAARNLGTERLGITSGALGLQPANVGQTSTQPLYSSTAGSLLSGGLTGAYIGSLLGKV